MEKIFIVAYFTFREIIKSKIYFNVFLFGLGQLLITYIAYSFTYGEPSRVALDFGLGILSLSSVFMAIFVGVGLMSKEIENRTVYMIISRPISRSQFLAGKILGLISVLKINILILATMTLSLYFIIDGTFSSLILWSIVFTIMESIIVLLMVCFFSLITVPTLAVIFSIGLYISGHAINATQMLSLSEKSPLIYYLLKFYHFILPGYYKLNIKDFILYKQTLDWDYLLSTLIYAGLYSCALIFLCLAIFERKNLD